MEKHPYFTDAQFNKSYRAVTRSLILKPNEKALINHIITWQETTDKKTGKLLNLICFESNSTIAYELGIPASTLEQLITKMNKKYDFFSSKPEPGMGKSKRGGNNNRTFKKIDMVKLAAFLKAEETARNVEPQEDEETLKVKPEVMEEAVIASEAEPFQQELTPQPVKTEMIAIEQQVCLVNPIKARANKNEVFYQLSYILDELDCAYVGEDDEVQTALILALANHDKLTQEKKIIYNEWITDFMKEDYLGYKEAYFNWLKSQQVVSPTHI